LTPINSLTFPLKQPILNLGYFHGCGAFFVVVSHVIDPSAYGTAPHQRSVVGFNSSDAAPPVPFLFARGEREVVTEAEDLVALDEYAGAFATGGAASELVGNSQMRLTFEAKRAFVEIDTLR
jgi:hypothetical protein